MEAYTEISFLQNGNMTWIFKAKDITSRDVVFKVFFPRYIANIIFKYERRILLKITSIPQVQKYIDDFAIPTETLNTLLPNFKNSLSEGEFILDKCLVLVMEFAPGMDPRRQPDLVAQRADAGIVDLAVLSPRAVVVNDQLHPDSHRAGTAAHGHWHPVLTP